jgi:hypothetical protein
MGARFLGVTLVASIVWFALHWHEYSLARAGARILIFAFAGSILGKLVGIAVYRLRTRVILSKFAKTRKLLFLSELVRKGFS